MGDGSRKELEALKDALARILQEENPLPPREQDARVAELSRRLSSSSPHDGPSPAQALDPKDLSIISRLLSQVHHLMEGDNTGEEPIQMEDVERSDFHHHHIGTEKKIVETVVEIAETVVEIASAAAEAAKAAAASSGKNLEVMETLLNSEKNVRHGHDEEGCAAEPFEDRQPTIDKDVVKRLERQNRITHWVLGLMIVVTAVWRFKMLSMILGVRRTFTNPFQTLGDMVSDGFKGINKEDQNGGTKGLNKARTVLPTILGGEEKEITKKTEKTEHSTFEDFKIGEAFTFSLDNLLSVGGVSEKHVTEGAADEASSNSSKE